MNSRALLDTDREAHCGVADELSATLIGTQQIISDHPSSGQGFSVTPTGPR